MLRFEGRLEPNTPECMEVLAWPWGYSFAVDGALVLDDVVHLVDTREGILQRAAGSNPLSYRWDGQIQIELETLRGRVEVLLGDPDDPFDPPASLLKQDSTAEIIETIRRHESVTIDFDRRVEDGRARHSVERWTATEVNRCISTPR